MLTVIDWGRTNYSDALEQQKSLVQQRINGQIGDTLIITEHNPVFTTGMRKGASKHLIWSAKQLAHRGIEFLESNRGGDITYHGPGQIVVYPIVSLQARKDLHAYLRDLELVVIQTLSHFNLESSRRDGKTGIWLENQRKICAIGVAVRSWITYHGLALNLNPDLSNYNGIVPCGITDGEVTSLAMEMTNPPSSKSIKSRLAVEFEAIFATIGN
ncbi:MAG: lipoyl(octanoyl) transferase [Puniceicoccaceae bacterium MED-G31]|nr:lipoyl(octanoyl) transferase [Coraliomargarita sp.]PDH28546.1 MAG: lipoyl(octanoyl) transferase [Puniceicoccaceae bacterium MED-G31]